MTVNDREFRQYLSNKRLEQERQEAAAANSATQPAVRRKPPATAKGLKSNKTRSAYAGLKSSRYCRTSARKAGLSASFGILDDIGN